MIKQIKYQRIIRNLNYFLSNLKIVYYTSDKTVIGYEHKTNTIIYEVGHIQNKLFVNYYNISHESLQFDLEKKDIIKIINDKFNTKNYELIIND